MARSFLGAVVKAARKSVREAERENKKRDRENQKNYRLEKKHLQKNLKEKDKRKTESLKIRHESDKEIRNNLSTETIIKFKLGTIKKKYITVHEATQIDFCLNIINDYDEKSYIPSKTTVSPTDIDMFLYSGKYNSVLGPEGFKYFKNNLKNLASEANKGTSKENLINLDEFFEVLIHAGIYYEFDQLPDDLKNSSDDLGWLTAYRFISNNFPSMTYMEFRQVVKNLSKSKGKVLEFSPEEKNNKLYKKIISSEVFKESLSLIHILSTLSMDKLRDLCSTLNIQSRRSKEETINEIIATDNVETAIKDIKHVTNNGLIFSLKDTDLVNGNDIIKLDKYLRDISKHIRQELINFIENKQSNTFL